MMKIGIDIDEVVRGFFSYLLKEYCLLFRLVHKHPPKKRIIYHYSLEDLEDSEIADYLLKNRYLLLKNAPVIEEGRMLVDFLKHNFSNHYVFFITNQGGIKFNELITKWWVREHFPEMDTVFTNERGEKYAYADILFDDDPKEIRNAFYKNKLPIYVEWYRINRKIPVGLENVFTLRSTKQFQVLKDYILSKIGGAV